MPANQRGLPEISLKRLIWRWHFIAGVSIAPFISLLAITGGIYIFRDDVDRWLRPELHTVAPGNSLANCEEMMDRCKEKTGRTTRPANAQFQGEAAGSICFIYYDAPETRIYCDPYTGKLLGETGANDFFRIVLTIHRSLYAGMFGRFFVEMATSWALMAFLSGFYLALPSHWRSMAGVLYPRLHGNRYRVLRDLHTVAGMWMLPIAFTIAFTGLMYSLVWGRAFNAVAEATHSYQVYSRRPESTPSTSKAPFPLADVVRSARQEYPGSSFYMDLPRQPSDVYRVYVGGPRGPSTLAVMSFDQFTGEPLEHSKLADWPLLGQWSSWNYPLHAGTVLGMPTKLLWSAACAVLVALPFTGIWMWWQRKPPGVWGIPRGGQARAPSWFVAALMGLSILLPMAGMVILIAAVGPELLQPFRKQSINKDAHDASQNP